VDRLKPSDLTEHPVWEFDLAGETLPGRDETWVLPVDRLPVKDLANRVIGATVRLNNGRSYLAILGNVDPDDEQATREFLSLSIWYRRKWRRLARPFDVDYERNGPDTLAKTLGLTVADVFPMTYDVSEHVRGKKGALRGTIAASIKADEDTGRKEDHPEGTLSLMRFVAELTPTDLEKYPVWETVLGGSKAWPVANLPVDDMFLRLAGTTVVLRNGDQIPAILQRIELDDKEMTQDLIGISVWHRRKWIELAHPNDPDDYARNGPEAFAKKLGLTVAEVFPISYDISKCAEGLKSVLKGKIKPDRGT
jgi:hypothetical protein